MPHISRKRDIGTTKLKTSGSTHGRTDGSKRPRKHLLPPLRFSCTACATTELHPDPKGDATASAALLSNVAHVTSPASASGAAKKRTPSAPSNVSATSARTNSSHAFGASAYSAP